MSNWIQTAMAAAGSGGAWALPALALATLVSEDLACIAAGLLVARGTLEFAPAATACFAGIFAGDLLLVLLGRGLGRTVLTRWPLRGRVSAEALARSERWFARRGASLILASRFMPGTRLPTYVAAGVLRMPVMKFIGWFALACALWTPLLVLAAMLAGEAALGWFETWQGLVPAVLLAGLAAWLLMRLAAGLATWRGRRLLLSRWRRLTRWEFWPAWAVYPPVVVYILWLGLRHRGWTLFTAVNPGMGRDGGFVGESKSMILRGLAGAGGRVADWTVLPPGPVEARAAALAAWRAKVGAGWPVVLKPDVGERGGGVAIVRDEAAARAKLAETPEALIAQRHVPGVEFGVFYYRIPSEEGREGGILAVTEKRLVSVTGDGRRTLEELILADDRAVCMARFFLRRHEARLDEAPAAGEAVRLSELGTHCLGALFLDGERLITPELVAATERVSRTFEGFYFGRYDVRTESAEALMRGEFTVIELNGVTSEATSMYDPAHSVWFGWRTLCRQWRIAFAIAAENRARGVRPLTVAEFFRLVRTRGRTAA